LICDSVFDTPVTISPIHYRQFKKAEKRLLAKGIYPSDYAKGISEHLKEWVYQKGWTHVPINVFCGQWALDKYANEIAPIKFFETPKEIMEEGMMLHSELLAARYYILHGGSKDFDEVVEDLRPMLHNKWLEAYENADREEVVLQALKVLSVEYGRPTKKLDELLK
jgi:hypothetical protein